jgi:DNA polymerase III delta prime subunit
LLAVCECTPEQLPLIERQDPHLVRAFAQVQAVEPGPEQMKRILHEFARRQGRAALTAEGLDEVLRLHRRYATYSANPGRPVRFLRDLLADQPTGQPVTASVVTMAFSKETGLPLVLLEESERLDLDSARRWFAARVIGQEEAVGLVVDLLATVKAVLNRPRKPIASLLFIGPTGVGKTEMAKALAAFLFGDVGRLTRFDMSEYSDAQAVQRLIGGVGGEGLLTARVREQPFAVVLLDEVEKADAQLFDLLLQVLGEGRLTDTAGRLADFCNSVVIMTSNLGAESYLQGAFGFLPAGSARQEARDHFVREVQRSVRPELFNRIDRIVPFAPLDEETTRLIARRQLDLLRGRDGIRYRGVSLETADDLPGWLARRGHDARYGARPLKRAIERELLAPLSVRMNEYVSGVALRARVGLKQDALDIQVRARTDEGGQQVPLGGVGISEREIAEECQALRRSIQTMQGCSAYLEVLNDLHRLERVRRREFYDAELGELRRLRDSVNQQYTEASAREDEALLVLYGEGGNLDHLRAPLEAARRRFDESTLELYLRQFPDSNLVSVVVYSEEVETLVMLTAAYRSAVQVSCTVPLYQYLAPTKPEDAALRRRVDDMEKALTRPEGWKGVIGAGLAIEGKASCPRLLGESGQHVIQTIQQTTRALVCTNPGGIDRHEVPEGIQRRGTIASHPKRRTYRLDKGRLDDQILGEGPLPGKDVAESLPLILEELLWRSARAVLQG